AVERREPAIGAGMNALDRHELHGAADGGRHLLGRLDAVGGDVDRPEQHVLALEQLQEPQRYARMDAFERDLVDAALGQRREDLLVLPPLAAEALLPLD